MSVENKSEETAYIKVEKLNSNSRGVNLIVKVMSKGEPRETVSRADGSTHTVADVLAADDTASIYLTLWDDNIEKVKNEDVLDLKNVFVSLYRGSMRLNIGRYSSLETSEEPLDKINVKNNLSDQVLEQPRRKLIFKPAFGPSEDRRGRRRRRTRR